MSREIVFRPQAVEDVLGVRAWYEARRMGLGCEFGLAVETLLARIVDNPLLFQCVHSETRRAILSRFPYAIYFRITESQIVVLAVHGRQHQSRWQQRSQQEA